MVRNLKELLLMYWFDCVVFLSFIYLYGIVPLFMLQHICILPIGL